MTMTAFRLARARQINDDWKFPKFLALVMPKDALGQAVAIAARASASEVLLDGCCRGTRGHGCCRGLCVTENVMAALVNAIHCMSTVCL